jgi:hypothetical protein
MFAQIRRHQKWLWIMISSLVIISFVWYFNPNSRRGGGGFAGDDSANAAVGSVYGKPISRSHYFETQREAQLWYFFRFQEWPQDNDFYRQMGRPVERHTRERLVLIDRLNELSIKVSDEAVANYIYEFFRDRETKTFRKELFDNIVNQQLAPHGLKRADFERYVRHELGIQHLVQLAGATGRMVTPQEAEMEYRQEHRKADAKLVAFPSTNYLAQVQLNPDALATFFTNNASAYRIPERVQLVYVAFPATNFYAQAGQKLNGETNLNLQIEQIYAQRGTNYYTEATGKPLTPEAAKTKIRDEARHDVALLEAQREANAFTEKLLAMPAKTNTANPAINLETLASSSGLAPQFTAPFSEAEGPQGLNVPAQFSRIAFQLSPEQPILEEPIRGDDAVYVVSFKNRFKSEVPPLDSDIRPKVEADFRRRESNRLAREAGAEFARKVKEAGEDKFEELAKAAGYPVIDLPPFTQTERDLQGLPSTVDDASVKNVAFSLKPNQVSSYTSGINAGFVLKLEQIIPVSDSEVKSDLASFMDSLRKTKTGQAFQDWFQHEMENAKLQLRGDKDNQDEAM